MALYNNKFWLLSHIRNSFISTDDTGMCEIIMEGQTLPKHLVDALNTYPDSEDSQDDDEEDFNQNDSFELQLDLDLPVRLRSDTAVRSERMDLAKKRAAKTKHIKWEQPHANSNFQLIAVDSKETHAPQVVRKSLLSKQIVNCTKLPQNPFIQYSKFDGSAQVGIPIRRYRIFLTMLPEEQRNYPMTVVCVATARIEDLIGLICFKCSTAHGDFQLQPVSHYGLYITEEDGEVDRDFPSLDSKECVAKFGFTCLGLVEERRNSKNLSFESGDDADGIDETTVNPPENSNAQAQDDAKQDCVGMQLLKDHTTAMEAPLYKSYRVYVIYRMRAKVEIHLGITGDKIEIDPVRQKSSKFVFSRHKPVSHSMDSIASCDIIDSKSSKSVFRIVYSTPSSFSLELPSSSSFHMSSSFKHYDFETDHSTAEDIVQKVNMILEIRSSASRKEYLDLQTKKNARAKYLSKSSYKW